MTVKEKRKKLQEHCENRSCINCLLKGEEVCSCGCGKNFKTMSNAEAIGAYEIVFGDETSKTIRTEDDETVITIKSKTPLDSVDIYFKEDK